MDRWFVMVPVTCGVLALCVRRDGVTREGLLARTCRAIRTYTIEIRVFDAIDLILHYY